LGKLVALPRHEELLFLGVVLEVAACLGACFQVLELTDLLLHGLEVREQSAEPPLDDVHAAAPLRLALDDGAELPFGADEEDVLTAKYDFAHELLRQLELTERLLKVDDVDPVPLGENEPAHLGIPTA